MGSEKQSLILVETPSISAPGSHHQSAGFAWPACWLLMVWLYLSTDPAVERFSDIGIPTSSKRFLLMRIVFLVHIGRMGCALSK